MAGQGSARVILNEIDLSQVRNQQQLPQGVPAAVVGPARKGPAFVPQTFANMQQFNEMFGNMLEKSKDSNSNIFGPLALNEWMKSAQAGTYVRVLGVGDGKSSSGGGRVEESGFIVGNKLVQKQEGDLGKIDDNPHANISDSESAIELGRTHFLGCFMKETVGNTTLSDSGINTTAAQPIIRGVLMTPQGVRPALNPNASLAQFVDINDTGANPRKASDGLDFGSNVVTNLVGYVVGEVVNQGFKLILNGYSNTQNPAVLSCSFDPESPAYFAKVLNTDPTKIEELGHYLYAHWDIDASVAIPSNEGLVNKDVLLTDVLKTNYVNMIGFLVAGAAGRDASAAGKPNYEDFSSRFRTAKTPWITSQRYGGQSKRLFRLHALDDGEISNGLFRLLVSNLAYAGENKYGSFDLILELLESNPISGSVLAAWKNLSLDPNSKNFIARVIGDKHAYFDFERDESKQRLVVDGSYELKNKFVRVELSDDLLNDEVDIDALPCGFEGHDYLFTKSTGNFVELDVNNASKIFTNVNDIPLDILSNAMVPPVDYVKSISRNIGSSKEASSELAWGVKFSQRKYKDSDLKELIEEGYNHSIKSYAKYFPHFGSVPVLRTHEDDATFQNAEFNLEKIEIRDVNASGELLSFDDAEYRRDGTASAAANKRFLKISTDGYAKNSKYLKFRCMFQGGFDGVNIFDDEKSKFTGTASLRENYDETSSNKKTGPTVNAYIKAVDVLSDKSAAEFQVLAIPGQRASVVTDHAMKSCEERFDALYIMDIEEVDAVGVIIEDSLVKPHVRNTLSNFETRLLDSSFGAAYFPNITMPRPSDRALIVVPPSVALLGVLSRNDAISAPWFAPAGLNRGAVVGSRGVSVQMNRDLLNEIYDVDINPLYEPAGRPGEVYVFGQKTLMQSESALDRINVRRLLIDLRRKVKKIGEQLLFEPNRESTLVNFSRLVEPIMQDAQRRQGVTRYKVQIDTTTTTQNDVENNTIRGKIYLQPTKSIEFISLDFIVTNTL